MFSSLVASPTTIASLTSQGGQGNPPAPPGVRGGPAPTTRSVARELEPIGQSTDGLDTLQQQLEGFKPQLDNTGKPIFQPDVDPLTPSVVPKFEDFKEAAGRLAGSIQIDETLAATALGGDAGSLQKLLQGVVQQALQQTMHVSAGFANTYAHEQAKKAVDASQKRAGATSSEHASLQAAYAAAPTLNTPMGTEFLRSTMVQLRKEYPTAPAELLGKFAATKIMSTLGQQQKPADPFQPDVDWGSELNNL